LKVIAFQGSPRIKGNTEILLDETLKPIREEGHEIVLFKLNLMKIKPCQDCGGCKESGICIINDDMNKIYRAIREADRIILASPVFFSGLSAQAKTMIDRCQAFWCEKYLLKKPIPEGRYGRKGLLLLVGSMKREIGIQCSEAAARAFFRTISVPKDDTLSFTGIEAKGEILKHPTALSEAHFAGRKLIKITK
jgi:multimeric flavodoxin WrbA